MTGAAFRAILKADSKKLQINGKDVEAMQPGELLDSVYLLWHELEKARKNQQQQRTSTQEAGDAFAKILDVFFNGRKA